MRTIIRQGYILTATDDQIRKASVGIEEDQIVFIGDEPDTFMPDRVIDGSRGLIMPGLINTHTHSAMSLLRNYADDLPFWEWLMEKIWPIEEKMEAHDVYWGSMLSIAEMIFGGTTAFGDMYFCSEETAKAAASAGIRCSIAKGLVGSSEEDNKRFTDTRRLVNQWHGAANGLITIMAGPHAPYTCDDAFIGKVLDLCRELNISIHIHLAESRKEVEESLKKHGRSPIQHMDHLGLFTCHTLAAHCVHLLPADFDILQKNGVSVAHNPTSNLKLGNGIAPVTQLLQRSINVCLGTDGSASNNNQNLFEEMHIAALLAKGISEDPTTAPADIMLGMATKNGAKALGIDHETGTLEKGKKADLIMINLDQPHFYPQHNLSASLVYSAQASDVNLVMVNGVILMERGELKTIDQEKLIFEISNISQRLMG